MVGFRNYIDYDIELEKSVIGILLMEPMAYSLIRNILMKECFYSNIGEKYYDAIKSVYEKGYQIDYLIVQRHMFDLGITEIEGSNIPYLTTQIMSGVLSSAHLVTWALLLRELGAKRKMHELRNSGGSQEDVFDQAAAIDNTLRDILSIKITDDWVHISQVAIKLDKYMMEVSEKGIEGVSTGLRELDEINWGFRKTNLIVIGARPSVGKSAFMGRIASRAAFSGKTVGIISLEMEDKDILGRMIASASDVPFWRIERNALEHEEIQRQKVRNAMSNLATLPIYYSDTAQVNMIDIRTKAEKLKMKHGLDLLIIDYLQLIEPEQINNRNREQEVSKISRGLKLLAMNLKIPVIILAQLNRQSAETGDKKPQLHHLRESGSIEQDADVVMFLHRDWQSGIKVDEQGNSTESQADLLIRKWRNGATVDIKLGFTGDTMKFFELSETTKFTVAPPEKPNAGFQNYRPPTPPEDDTPF